MEVRIHRSTIIPHAYTNTEPAQIPFNIFDRFALDAHMAALFAFHPPQPPNSVIIRGLAEALAHFPTLTATVADSDGRRNRSRILAGGPGGGARVAEAVALSRLSDHLPLEPQPGMRLLHPSCNKGEVPPPTALQIQLTRFECGGLIVGLTFDHRVAHGGSISLFFTAWGQAVCGVPIDSCPVYDQSWLKPPSPPRCDYQHWGHEFMPTHRRNHKPSLAPSPNSTINSEKITNILLHYSWEFISSMLKTRVKEKYTSFEILLGYLWRKIMIARCVDRGVRTNVRVSINDRSRLKHILPNNYFGNLVLSAYPSATVRDGGITKAAKIVHESIIDIRAGYFQSFIDFGKIHEEEDIRPAYSDNADGLSSNLEVTSWLGFKYDKLNFGGRGNMCAFLPTWSPFDGWLAFFPSVYDDGGIDAVICLYEEHATRLRQISHLVEGPLSCL